MASDIEICNLGLAHLGDAADIAALDEGSAQADHCARFYPIARNQLLAMHAWGFATKREALALLDTDELPDTWAYCYTVPSNCIQVISILAPSASTSVFSGDPYDPLFGEAARPGDLDAQPYVQEVLQDGSKVIFTNVEDANIRYVDGITDPTKFSPLFVTTLARLLASYLAGPVIKGETGMKVAQAQYKAFIQVEFPYAVAMDQKGQRVNAYKDFIPGGLQARR